MMTMKRFALMMACALMLAGSGCCGFGGPFGGYGGGYGAGYGPSYGGGGCPGGACGAFPGAYNGGYTGTAMTPYGGQTAFAPQAMPAYQSAAVNYMPVY